jgi:hypothetical protein
MQKANSQHDGDDCTADGILLPRSGTMATPTITAAIGGAARSNSDAAAASRNEVGNCNRSRSLPTSAT